MLANNTLRLGLPSSHLLHSRCSQSHMTVLRWLLCLAAAVLAHAESTGRRRAPSREQPKCQQRPVCCRDRSAADQQRPGAGAHQRPRPAGRSSGAAGRSRRGRPPAARPAGPPARARAPSPAPACSAPRRRPRPRRCPCRSCAGGAPMCRMERGCRLRQAAASLTAPLPQPASLVRVRCPHLELAPRSGESRGCVRLKPWSQLQPLANAPLLLQSKNLQHGGLPRRACQRSGQAAGHGSGPHL